jgi:hypothetical protein
MITIFIAKCDKDDYRVTLASSKESVLSKPIQFLSDATSFTSYSDAIIAANDMKISEDILWIMVSSMFMTKRFFPQI